MTDPLGDIMRGFEAEPIGTTLRALHFLESTREASHTNYLIGLRVVARYLVDSQPSFAIAIAKFVAVQGDPRGGAKSAIRFSSWRAPSPNKLRALVDEAEREKSQTRQQAMLELLATETRRLQIDDAAAAQLGFLYIIGLLRDLPTGSATKLEPLLVELVALAPAEEAFNQLLRALCTRDALTALAAALA